jgi:hypothetical protein
MKPTIQQPAARLTLQPFRPGTFAECMDVLDWFDDSLYDYLYHIWVSKSDGNARIERVLPNIIDHAADLVAAHADTEIAYPVELLNQTA